MLLQLLLCGRLLLVLRTRRDTAKGVASNTTTVVQPKPCY